MSDSIKAELVYFRIDVSRPERQAWMEPPAIIGFFCEYLIEPGGHETLPPETVASQ